MDDAERSAVGPKGVVIFDGSCGLCSTLVGRRRRFFERYGFSVAPLQDEWVQKLCGVDEHTLREAIHLWTPQGEVVRGVDFFQRVAQAVWWLLPVRVVLGIRPLRPLFDRIYGWVARHRKEISRVCRLDPRSP